MTRWLINEYCIEIRFNGTSICPGEYRIVARGGLSEMRALFPIIVSEAGVHGYEGVVLFDSDWDTLAHWARKGVNLPAALNDGEVLS